MPIRTIDKTELENLFEGNAKIGPARLLRKGMAQSNRAPSVRRCIKKLLAKLGAANFFERARRASTFASNNLARK
jgi:hypothetical protein